MTYFNANIKTFREVNNLKQSEIEHELGLSKGDWSTYENGIEPKLEVIVSIFKFFNTYYPKLIIDMLVIDDLSYLYQNNALAINVQSKSIKESNNRELIDKILAPTKKKNIPKFEILE